MVVEVPHCQGLQHSNQHRAMTTKGPPESLQRQHETHEQVLIAMCWTIPASLCGKQARRCWSVTAWGKCPLFEPLGIPSGFLQ